jgi:DNA-directed RNA polymerase subunit RPC12/RpoP
LRIEQSDNGMSNMLTRKEYRRQEAEILVDEAVGLDGVRVRYLPSFRTIRCDYCGHSGRARIPHNTKVPKFKCSQCGRK